MPDCFNGNKFLYVESTRKIRYRIREIISRCFDRREYRLKTVSLWRGFKGKRKKTLLGKIGFGSRGETSRCYWGDFKAKTLVLRFTNLMTDAILLGLHGNSSIS